MNRRLHVCWLASAFITWGASRSIAADAAPSAGGTVRVAAAQAARRVIDFRLKPDEAVAAVERNLAELERIIDRAGEAKCDALVLPEDTPGMLNWVGANESAARDVLPKAVRRMLERLGAAAARHKLFLVVCSDHVESDGGIYNTAFLLGRDGVEIGRYHKVCPTWSEAGARSRGDSFPVFPTPDLGTVGMLICYDLVVPETARCLALAGADIIFFPTMGGAAIGDDDIGVQALRVRAAENFIWLVVAHRGSGAMIISPQGKIVAKAEGPDGLAIADIDPRGQREGGDAMNRQRDMRARLFRERHPEAFKILTEPRPPVLEKVPIDLTSQEAGRIMARTLSIGDEEFKAANELIGRGKIDEARSAFERLRREYPGTWIDRRSRERLATLPGTTPSTRVAIVGGRWHLNGTVTYPGTAAEGLLMNVRMVNATFDDANPATRPAGFDADENTREFIARIPDYVAHGVRALTLNLQGGMPGYERAVNSAFNPDGTLRDAPLERVRRVIEACNAHGAVVILGCFYQRQDQVLENENAVRVGVVNVAKWIRSRGFGNVVLEIANEFGHGGFDHRILKSADGQVELIELARKTTPGLLVSTSGLGGGGQDDQVARAADFILVHFNNTRLDDIPARIATLRKFGKPIVCNEDQKTGADGAAAAQACVANGASWGLMIESLNQHAPFVFNGSTDDPVVYAALARLTSK